ncbi:hypothetical protein [Haloarcula litorea]|uniref:hypothetical protein n=1 Tax=Haloarcula litorea TaxID=3032579 RepID=UPI0023E8670C|nr:hypothetical protein [Halomicroarcula sp. GDY20]
MVRFSRPATGGPGSSVARPTDCPTCGTELDERAGAGICPACDWVQGFPSD